jgi:hypothetical protein
VDVKRLLQALLLITASAAALPAWAAETAAPAGAQDKPVLEERIRSAKEEVLQLNRDLGILEEELLYPASTQLAVFLSIDVGNFFRLDSVQLKIDDKMVASHLYTTTELDALRRGGVQRLYMGNIKSGEHQLVAEFSGPGPNDSDYRHASTLKFNKQEGAKFIELRILDAAKKLQPEFVIREWE